MNQCVKCDGNESSVVITIDHRLILRRQFCWGNATLWRMSFRWKINVYFNNFVHYLGKKTIGRSYTYSFIYHCTDRIIWSSFHFLMFFFMAGLSDCTSHRQWHVRSADTTDHFRCMNYSSLSFRTIHEQDGIHLISIYVTNKELSQEFAVAKFPPPPPPIPHPHPSPRRLAVVVALNNHQPHHFHALRCGSPSFCLFIHKSVFIFFSFPHLE